MHRIDRSSPRWKDGEQMSYIHFFLVGSGGFFGAIVRYIIAKHYNVTKQYPLGTLVVNLFGALLIGFIFGLDLSRNWTYLLATGVAGALTTFSTMMKEILELWRTGKKVTAVNYLAINISVGLLLSWLGYEVGHSVS